MSQSDSQPNPQPPQKETHGFQAEVKQLLQLMIHSMYSNREVFLRELISNASDALDTLRFAAVGDDSLYEKDPDLAIWIEANPDARTLTISDNGIGMTRDEVIERIGTIAKSGTRALFEGLSGDQKKDAHLIGQFGVGFYSAFIVADKVTLTTRKAGQRDAVRWESDGGGEYSIEDAAKPGRGTEVVLHLRAEDAATGESADSFLESWRLQDLIQRYSDHIAFPIKMRGEPNEEDKKAGKVGEWQQINRGAPLWARPKSDIAESEYKGFYKHVAHDFDEPLAWTHNKVEGSQEYTSLLYIPKRAPLDLMDPSRSTHGIKLYVQRVFIMDDAEKLMPRYLRFVRGVVDSNDLPLNVSREILQSNRVIDKIRGGSVKKLLALLQDMAAKRPDDYAAFWAEFGAVLKEGVVEDADNRDTIAGLARFASTKTEDDTQSLALADYVARMGEGQDKIYYHVAESLSGARNSPHLEVFKKKDIEVLLLTDRVDEWVMAHLDEFEGKRFQSVAKGALDLGEAVSAAEKEEQEKLETESKDLLKRLKKALGEAVGEVRVTHRLTDSPACLVADERGLSSHLERILKEAGQAIPGGTKAHLEINPAHPLVTRLDAETEDARFADWAHLLHEQAVLAEGGELTDPAAFVRRMNQMLLALSGTGKKAKASAKKKDSAQKTDNNKKDNAA